jgi:hypothetical protein
MTGYPGGVSFGLTGKIALVTGGSRGTATGCRQCEIRG